METSLIINKFVRQGLSTSEMIDFAVEALLEGSDSKSMILLAGESPKENSYDLTELFRKALEEEGIDIPNKENAIQCHFDYCLRSIVSGSVSPYQGARMIYLEVYEETLVSG